MRGINDDGTAVESVGGQEAVGGGRARRGKEEEKDEAW